MMAAVAKRERRHPVDELRELAEWFAAAARDDPQHRPTFATARILEIVSLLFFGASYSFTDGRPNPNVCRLDRLADLVVHHVGMTGANRRAGSALTTKTTLEALHSAHQMVRTTLDGVKNERQRTELVSRILGMMLRSYFVQLEHAAAPDLRARLVKELRRIEKSNDSMTLAPKDTPRIIERALIVAGMAEATAHRRTKPLRDLWHDGVYRVPKVAARK